MRTIIGTYPNAFSEAEAILYFKSIKDGKGKFDPIFEQIVRNNFKTQEQFEAYIKKCEDSPAIFKRVG